MEKVGILGGTFDPPHLGHLIVAEQVRVKLQLKEVWFIPTNVPPHKKEADTTATDRLSMLKKSLKGNDFFKIHPIELNRKEKSYTIDTIINLKEQYSHSQFYFIIGADMVEYLPHWKKIDELVKLVHFVGVNRPGYQLQSSYPITIVEVPLIDISSSMIRERIQQGQSVTYLIPDSVKKYIKEKRLYGD